MAFTRPVHEQCSLFGLPNEILLKILMEIPTLDLFPLTPTCTRIHDLIIRIFHRRLLHAASLEEHKLILECYHPASKWAEPYMKCEYLGTPGLSSTAEGEGLVYESGSHASRFGKLAGLYSRFRPRRRGAKENGPRRHPAGGSVQQWLTPSQLPVEERDTGEADEDGVIPLVAHRVGLEADDSFSQLCVVTNLAKLGPREGIFTNIVNVSDGLVRIWRHWLKQRANASEIVAGEMADGEKIFGDDAFFEESEKRTLWMDHQTNIGLIVRIRERATDQPVISRHEDDCAVSYAMEYEELLVRTTHLLLAVEESLKQQEAERKGRAMVFGTFVNRASDET